MVEVKVEEFVCWLIIERSRDRRQLATISSPKNEPKVSTFWSGGGNRILWAPVGVGVRRVDVDVVDGWVPVMDAGVVLLPPLTLPIPTPPVTWGDAVEARCRGEASPPATTK